MRFSAALGCVLALTILLGIAAPLAGASVVTVDFLNPLAEVEPINNQPLAERAGWTFDENGNPDFNGKVVGLAWYSKETNTQALAAVAMKLKEEYPDVIIMASANVGSLFSTTVLTAATNPFPNQPGLVGKRLRNNSCTFANLASPWNAKTDANYNQWGGVTTTAAYLSSTTTTTAVRVDAMIYGVAD